MIPLQYSSGCSCLWVSFICTISERHNHLCMYTLHESLSKVHNVLIQRGYAKGNVHNFNVITVYRKTFASGVFFFCPFSIHCLWASLRLGEFEWFKLFLNTTLSRRIQERAKLFASEITLYVHVHYQNYGKYLKFGF